MTFLATGAHCWLTVILLLTTAASFQKPKILAGEGCAATLPITKCAHLCLHTSVWISPGLGGQYHAVAQSHLNPAAPFHPFWMKIRDTARQAVMMHHPNPKSISPVQRLHQNTPPASHLASSDYQMQNERNCSITVKLTF